MARGEFRAALIEALRQDLTTLQVRTTNETLYAVALYTSGQDDFQYVLTTANTEEGLREAQGRLAQHDPTYADARGERALRFSAGDWKYHGTLGAVEALELPSGSSDTRDEALYEDFVAALQTVERDGLLPRSPRPLLLIVCGDMSEAFFRQGLERLNPPEAVAAYDEQYARSPFLQKLDALLEAGEAETLVRLYADLYLEVPSPLAEEARAEDVHWVEVQQRVTRLGPRGIDLLVDLVEAHGFTSEDPGGPSEDEWGQSALASAAAFLLPECEGASDAHVERLQGLLARRVELDRARPMTTTVAENLARVLHRLRPRRFPESVLNPRTNHLENPEPFLRPLAASRLRWFGRRRD